MWGVGAWGHMAGWGWWMLAGWLLTVALIGAVVWALVAAGRGWRSPRGDERAAEILAERFARGEIDADEYRDQRALLR